MIYEVWLDNINRPWLELRTTNETEAKTFMDSVRGKYMYVSLWVYSDSGRIVSINNVKV